MQLGYLWLKPPCEDKKVRLKSMSCIQRKGIGERVTTITFSSVLSRSFLLKESTQSVKHFCTRELYMRKLHTKALPSGCTCRLQYICEDSKGRQK